MTKTVACLVLTTALGFGQELAVGKLIVARRTSSDPDFAHTVILLVRQDKQTTIGLFVNRPLDIPLSEVYPDMKGAQLKLYAGGPVALGIRTLYRSSVKPPDATRILDDIWMITKKTLLAEIVGQQKPSNVFRVYAGYVGWSPGQLQDEIRRGLWQVMPGDASIVFDPHPETIWPRLIGRLRRD
jgi:putative transcriptional regulator